MKFLIVLILVLWSCSRKTDDQATNQTDSLANLKTDTIHSAGTDYDSFFILDNYLPTGLVDTSKVQTFNFDCAIVVYPNVEQIEALTKEQGEDNFAAEADDSNFYQAEALQAIDSAGIKALRAGKQFITLVGEQKTWTLDIRKKGLPAWNLILFKKNKAPVIVPAIGLTTGKVRDYFESGR